jgi:SAM-dependent methyltransferase
VVESLLLLPPRETRIATTTPTAITAKAARMIQRLSACSPIGRESLKHPTPARCAVQTGLAARTIGFQMQTPALTPLAAAALRISPAPERVLEVECGDGDGALFLAREFPAARVRGVDRSEQRVRAATARVGLDPEGRVAFKLGRPGSLPYPDDFFDLLAQVDGRPAIGEIARVLRPGGHLILARSRRPGRDHGLGARLLAWRLARRGFEPLESAEVGDGSFSVVRLRGADRVAAAD